MIFQIGSVDLVREQQAHVLDVLQGDTIGTRTASDIAIAWLASLYSDPQFSEWVVVT